MKCALNKFFANNFGENFFHSFSPPPRDERWTMLALILSKRERERERESDVKGIPKPLIISH